MSERWIVRDSLGPRLNNANALRSPDTDMSFILKDYFVSVFANENTNNIPEVELYVELQLL